MINRDEKIVNEIIKPKDELIQKLYTDNLILHKELSTQSRLIEKAEIYEKEKTNLESANVKLQNKCNSLEKAIKNYENKLNLDFSNELKETTYKYEKEVKKMKDKIANLESIIENFKNTINKFITWVCNKFSQQSEDEMIHQFETETHISFNSDKLASAFIITNTHCIIIRVHNS